MTNSERTPPEERPSIALTELDRETLFRLLGESESSEYGDCLSSSSRDRAR